jgi:predicted enzyme related to lactoylglutathione lyase
MPRPIHFEIPAGDIAAMIGFYETVFGWKIRKVQEEPVPYWLISTGEGPGIDGGLLPRRSPHQPCVNTIGVEDIDAALVTVAERGGKIALPKFAVPGVGWLAYCQDPEGNMFGLMQNDASAA